MNVGDKLYLKPTMDSALMKGSSGPQPCWVVAVNEKHRHFTVEFEYPAGKFREGYGMEAAQ